MVVQTAAHRLAVAGVPEAAVVRAQASVGFGLLAIMLGLLSCTGFGSRR